MINMVVDLDYQDGIQITQKSTLRHVCKSTSREFWLKEDELPCVWEHHSISRSLQDCFILEEWTGGLTVKSVCCSCRGAEFSSHIMQLTNACEAFQRIRCHPWPQWESVLMCIYPHTHMCVLCMYIYTRTHTYILKYIYFILKQYRCTYLVNKIYLIFIKGAVVQNEVN